jgi:hypothetical protein
MVCQRIMQYALKKTVKRIKFYVMNVILMNILTTLKNAMYLILLTLNKKYGKNILLMRRIKKFGSH